MYAINYLVRFNKILYNYGCMLKIYKIYTAHRKLRDCTTGNLYTDI